MLPQVTFRGMPPSAQVVDTVCRRTRKLGELAPLLRGCHVVIDAAARGHGRPILFRVSVQLSNGNEAGRRNAHASDPNLTTALREAFRAMRRQLELKDRHSRADALLQQLERHAVARG